MKVNPLIAKLEKMGYEIMFFDKPIDEFAFQEIKKYEDLPMVNCANKFDLPESDIEKKEIRCYFKRFQAFNQIFRRSFNQTCQKCQNK